MMLERRFCVYAPKICEQKGQSESSKAEECPLLQSALVFPLCVLARGSHLEHQRRGLQSYCKPDPSLTLL
jgi:hypothetical protein